MKDANQQDGNTERAQRILKAGPVRPEWVLFDSTLSGDEKRWILRQLIADLEAQLRASEENMTGNEAGDVGERLRTAQSAIASID